MVENKIIEVGKKIRDFTLRDQDNQRIRLSDFKGRKILLSFHPLAWTSICAKQMKSLEKNITAFQKNNTVALGLSVDSSFCKNAWAKTLDINKTRLLADFWPHGKIAKSLGILNKTLGFSERTNIVIDEKGVIVFVKVYPIKELPDLREIFSILKKKI
jgi:peroxiredoxin